MYSRSFVLTAVVVSLSLVDAGVTDPHAICYSYGVDFIDEGQYFINSESTEDFTAVSYFQGCNEDVSDVLLVAPEDISGKEEFLCGKVATTPDDENQVATCPIKKNEMISGHWLLLILGNNGEGGQPFAWQRDLYLTVGTQITDTYTPTVTMGITTTPTQIVTVSTTSTDVITAGPLSTVTVPSGTARKIKTVRPKPVKTTITKTMTRTRLSFTKEFSVTTKTVEATCTTPGHTGKPDKPCSYSPTLLHPAALVKPTTIPKFHRWSRKGDREVDYEWARARIEAAKQRREAAAAAPFERRAPDAPTTTVTAETPITTTTTMTAAPFTTTETVLHTTATTTTLPPATVLSGILTRTTTLPTPTKTKFRLAKTTTTKVITFGGTFTKTRTVTPTASVSACKKQGGHFWWH
ncbi:hypothetical protein BDW02DRAFT_571976 [Decorospora gaudefroyi]|uniref:Uncharacterized protein n=1 Tax=Decorospora gaudefroyi TaxID=184978 RepID=A0A6A5K946_9PLEO|nr:hypothetical protein BDW02DRAFT_571976 [Decorospora gaudefroyi]